MCQYWSQPPDGPWIVYQTAECVEHVSLLPPVPCIRIVRHARAVQCSEIVEVLKKCEAQRPEDVVLYAAQCDAHFRLNAAYPAVIRWNHNALVDATVFTLGDGPVTKSPLMISRFVPFKRIELAKEIPGLRVIGEDENPTYREWVQQQFNFTWLNSKLSFLSPHQVAAELQQSSVLVLTSTHTREGNCRAVTEALLTGCPVLYVRPQPMCTSWLVPATSVAARQPTAEELRELYMRMPVFDRDRVRSTTLARLRGFQSQMQTTLEKVARLFGFTAYCFDIEKLVRSNALAWVSWSRWLDTAPEVIRRQVLATIDASCLTTSR